MRRTRSRNYLSYDVCIHWILWFRRPNFELLTKYSFRGEKSVAEIYVTVLVDIPMLTRPENERLLAVRRLCKIYDNTLTTMLTCVRDDDPKMVYAAVRTPNVSVPDGHAPYDAAT